MLNRTSLEYKKVVKKLIIKDNKNNFKIKDIIFNNIKIIVPILVSALVVLLGFIDYITFVSIFNFKTSTFLDVYLFNINLLNSSLLLVILFLPIFIVIFIFTISYLSMSIPYILYKDKLFFENNNIFISYKYGVIFISIFHSILTIGLSNFLLAYTNTLFLYIFIVVIIPVVINLLIMPFIIKCSKKNRHFINSYSFSNFFISLLFYTLYIGFSTDNNLKIFLIFILVINLFSLQFLELIFQDKLKRSFIDDINIKSVVIGSTIIAVILITSFLIVENEKAWTQKNYSASSASVFLNKLFKSDNPMNIEINVSSLNLNKDINLTHIEELGIVILDKNTTYLPIAKDMKLYFLKNKDTNRTLIFAVEKKYYRGKYNYHPIDIGYFESKKMHPK